MKTTMKRSLLSLAILAAIGANGAQANTDAVCIGDNFEQGVPQEGVTPPSARIQTDSLYLQGGESVELSVDATVDSGANPFYFWCADAGRFELVAEDASRVRYIAPLTTPARFLKIGVQVGDDLGYVGGHSVLMQVDAEIVEPPTIEPVTIAIALGGGNNAIALHELDGSLKRLIDTGTSGGDLSLASVDLNGDGVYEGLGAIRGQGGGTLFYYLLDGQYSTRAVDAQGAIIAADDSDGDGIADWVVATNAANRDGVYTYESASGGNPTAAIQMFDRNSEMSIASGDTDGDGKIDLIAGGMGAQTQGRVSVVDGDGDRREFSVFGSTGVNGNPGIHAFSGDLNCDGKADIGAAMMDKSSWIEVLDGEGNRLVAFEAFPDGRNKGVVATIANVMGDGDSEIIVGEVDGTRVRIFDRDGNQLAEFQTTRGNITDIAVNRSGMCGEDQVADRGVGVNEALRSHGMPEIDFDATEPPEPNKDSDEDGLDDDTERRIGSNPYDPDTDKDGVKDGEEAGKSDDPNNPNAAIFDAMLAALEAHDGQTVILSVDKGVLRGTRKHGAEEFGEIPDDLGIDKPKYGLFGFTVEELFEGDTVTVTIQFEELSGVETFVEHGFNYETGRVGWFLLENAVVDTDNNRVILTLTDGRKGDTDRRAGVIGDPGGPAARAPVAGAASEPTPIPALAAPLLGFLGLLIAGLGFRHSRRREG